MSGGVLRASSSGESSSVPAIIGGIGRSVIILFRVGFDSGGVLGDVGESMSSRLIPGGIGNLVRLVGTETFLKSIFPVSRVCMALTVGGSEW